MKVKFEDVRFEKCGEYDPYSTHANSYGMADFWRATVCVGFFDYRYCSARTKADCIKEARRMVREINAEN
ncbi:MAG: hypothetical protein OSJ43_06700 [Oscillospiraceae bacterium]|nr:hypothetical protein [Oscillospiraceae bacterium]